MPVQSPTKEGQAARLPSLESERGITAFFQPVRDLLAKLWALDVRSLAVFRIALALVILFDLAIRASLTQALEVFHQVPGGVVDKACVGSALAASTLIQ